MNKQNNNRFQNKSLKNNSIPPNEEVSLEGILDGKILLELPDKVYMEKLALRVTYSLIEKLQIPPESSRNFKGSGSVFYINEGTNSIILGFQCVLILAGN